VSRLPALLTRTEVEVTRDPRRVAAVLFLPGQELGAPGRSRAAGLVARCGRMPDDVVAATLARVRTQYARRHADLDTVLTGNFAAIAHRVPEVADLSHERRLLIGAYFTREVAVEAAALFNPSVVQHPVQGTAPGELRFVMSARAVSEGHVSAVVFRSGTFAPAGGPDGVGLDDGSRFVRSGVRGDAPLRRDQLRRQALADGVDGETLEYVLANLPDGVDLAVLDAATDSLREEALTRTEVDATIEALRRTVASSYDVTFDPATTLSERTLFPETESESHGLEDARFTRFVADDGSASYAATYTAFDGSHVRSRRLDTDDFRTFRSSPLTGTAAQNKGMALFPRRVGGRYLALSRWDRENNAVATSADGYHWDDVTELQSPGRPWELTQLGNCGPPMETEAGWVVLTHGVGPMRGYAMGALLLDLDRPTKVVGRLAEPLLEPDDDERDGYVPNVVYSCGALVHDQKMLLPYGCSDTSIRFGVVDVPRLLERLVAG
jgi:predicted GH43/DUF377 family glycosyl hydrolase